MQLPAEAAIIIHRTSCSTAVAALIGLWTGVPNAIAPLAGLFFMFALSRKRNVWVKLCTADRRSTRLAKAPRRRRSDGFLNFVVKPPFVPLVLDVTLLTVLETRPPFL